METLEATARAKALYRTLWRWHFYAGLFAIPFVIILSISGVIYLFKPQIDHYNNAPFTQLVLTGERASADQHLAAALAAVPGSTFNAYQLPAQTNDAVQILVKALKDVFRVYVHPQSLAILQVKNEQSGLLKIAHDIHGELLLGKTGAVLVELAASWAIVLVLTGLYLWWPRNARGLAAVFYPRLSLKGRLFWRDLHSVVGIWSSLLVLFFLISGLPWALVWGSAFKEVRELTGALNQTQDWVIAGQHSEHLNQPTASGKIDTSLDAIVKSATALQFAPPVLIYPPSENKPNTPAWQKRSAIYWTVKSNTQNRPIRADAELDATTAEVVGRSDFSQRHIIDRIIGIGVAAHEGQLFGWLNQLLGLLIATSLVATCVSGFIMWRKRKPQFSLGAPPAAANLKLGYGFILAIALAALCLPLLAGSIAVIWIIEKCLISRWPAGRKWLLGT